MTLNLSLCLLQEGNNNKGPSWTIFLLKPGFYVLGKSQAIGYFSFCWPFQILLIYWIITKILSQILLILNLAGNGKWARGTGAQKFRGLVMSKIHNAWDCLETVKSQIVWDFPNVWKPGLKIMNSKCNNYVPESLWQSGKFCLLLDVVVSGNLQLLVFSPCTHLGAENSKLECNRN